MFTGLVTHTHRLAAWEPGPAGRRLWLEALPLTCTAGTALARHQDLVQGESICISGVCLSLVGEREDGALGVTSIRDLVDALLDEDD